MSWPLTFHSYVHVVHIQLESNTITNLLCFVVLWGLKNKIDVAFR